MEVLRRCPLAIASDLCTAQLLFQLLCLGRVTKTMSAALLLTNNLENSSKGSQAFLAQLHLPTHLFWAKLRVQLHLPPLRSLDLLISPETLPTLSPSLIGHLASVDVKHQERSVSGFLGAIRFYIGSKGAGYAGFICTLHMRTLSKHASAVSVCVSV